MSNHDVRKTLIITTIQYIVDSLYSIGANFVAFGYLTMFILNIYSASMIVVILGEASNNFKMLNFRLRIIMQQPNLMFLKEAIIRRKKLVSSITLLILNYFCFELLFHFVWDYVFYPVYGTLTNQLIVWTAHEIVDMMTVLMMLFICRESDKMYL